MRILSLAIAAAVALPLAFTGAAYAAPASGTIFGDISESGPSPRHPDDAGAALVDDFSQVSTDGNPSFTLGGPVNHIFGTIRHRNDNQYKDAWEMTITKATEIAFSWMPHAGTTGGFDGTFFNPLGDLIFSGTGSTVLGILAPGTYNFSVDATTHGTPEQLGHWKVSATAVPLPAGGLLLLTAVGGMALYRSRRKA
ncbi:MAG: VPLPA-CTERM sorting domain-containing protein [Pseudomonadota bacterium]